MRKNRCREVVRVRGLLFYRRRRYLLMSTALQATSVLVSSLPSKAQPAPNARPTGGVVIAGAAAINQTPSQTVINQTSQRGAVNWQSYNIGSGQSVIYHQPSSSSVTLNRVVGQDPSQIAGRIDANGQIILVNQSGVNFYKGAQVNAAGVMVSAAGISNQNFMAGVMKFDQAGDPNARIDNQGSITVKQAGLAALVAPRVANSGTITAQLGHVVLAGAKTATLDLYGDGLLSLDVTNQLTQAPVGKHGGTATALVTNMGTIIADGGTVQLTARAADGIVQNLVQAGGIIRAATKGDHTGTVALNGVGGAIVVEGQLSAPGNAPGTKGGAIEVVSNGNVVLASTARLNASGEAGGGVVAIGTTLDRARGGPGVTPRQVAATTATRSGATITADARRQGDGGRVAVLSSRATDMAGTITAKGGIRGGNGGFVEVSGDGAFSLTGAIDVGARLGNVGTILLDPRDLFISATDPGNGAGQITPAGTGVPAGGEPNAETNSWLTPTSINALTGAITIATTRDLFLQSPVNTIDSGVTSLTFNAGRNLDVTASVTVAGSLSLNAGGALTIGGPASLSANALALSSGTGGLGLSGNAVVAAPSISLTSGIGGIAMTDSAILGMAGSSITISSAGPVSEAPTSSIVAQVLSGTAAGDVTLLENFNGIAEIRDFSVTGGDLVVRNDEDLALLGDISARNLFIGLQGDNALTFGLLSAGSPTLPANLTATGPGGRISLVALAYHVASPDSSINLTAGTVELSPLTTFPLSLLGNTGFVVSSALLSIIKTNGGTLEIGGFTDIPDGANLPAARASSISIDGALNLAGVATTLRLDTTGAITEPGGPLTVTTLIGNAGSATFNNGGNLIGNLGSFTIGGEVVGNLSLVDAGALNITGAVSAATLALTAGGKLQIGTPGAAGSLTAGTVTLSANGPITEPNGAITATSFAASATGVVSDILLTNANNKIGSSTGITAASGNVAVVDDPTLVLSGPFSGQNLFFKVAGAGGTLTLGTPTISSEGIFGIPATLTSAGGGRISLVADNITVGNPASSVTANAGTVELAPFSPIDTTLLGTGGAPVVGLVVGAPLLSIVHTGSGTLEVGGFTDAATGATSPGASAVSVNVGPADLMDIASTLRLDALGAITQAGGPLIVGGLTGSAGTSANLTDPSNLIGRLSAFTTTAGFALVDNQALVVAGPVKDTGTTSALVVTTKSGDVTLAGNVSANVVDLTSAGAISQTGGTLMAGILTGSAATSASLTQPTNLVGSLGAFSTTAGFALEDNRSLLVTGPVTDTGTCQYVGPDHQDG